MKYYSTKKASEAIGIHPNTLRSWADNGKIDYIRTGAGQRRYDVDSYFGRKRKPEPETVCYCRVSSYKQKDDLERQVEFMQAKFPGARIVKDIGSGINFKRKGLNAILESSIDGAVLKVVVAHRDRLARFGVELIKNIIQHNGGELLVLSESDLSPEQELTKDLLTILHVFSCRVHGLRSYKNKISKAFAIESTEEDIQELD
jgi:predicted site-specific integrase-resolvase